MFPQSRKAARSSKQRAGRADAGVGLGNVAGTGAGEERIRTASLDWEKDDVANWEAVDLVIACDCIYNDALIEPLNSTAAAICKLRAADADQPTLVVVAQQLRSHEVFEAWLKSFARRFEVWQVPDGVVGEGLGEGSGFVVHVGVLRKGEYGTGK